MTDSGAERAARIAERLRIDLAKSVWAVYRPGADKYYDCPVTELRSKIAIPIILRALSEMAAPDEGGKR